VSISSSHLSFHYAETIHDLHSFPTRRSSDLGKIFQQRNHADDDDDHPYDLFGAAIEWQHVDEVEHQDDDKEGDEHTDEGVHMRRSEEHTSELQSPCNLVCRLLLEKKKNKSGH